MPTLGERLSNMDVQEVIDCFSSTTTGCVPASGGGTANFLRADGQWAAPTASAAWGSITGTLSTQTDVQSALDGKQPLDSDLTTIAGLTPTTDNFMVAAASAWASRTPAQAKTSLALVKGDVGLGSVDNTSDANKPVSTAQQSALNAKLNTSQFSGVAKISVGTVAPTSPATGDLWIDTN